MKLDKSEQQIKGIVEFNVRANEKIKELENENRELKKKITKLKRKQTKQYVEHLEKILFEAKSVLFEYDECYDDCEEDD